MGAGNSDAVRRAGLAGLGMGAILNGSLALLLAIFPRTVAGLYFDESAPGNADLLNQAVLYLRAAAAFEIFDALQGIAIQSLRGLKDTKVPMVITAIAYWAIGFPLSLVLSFHTSLGGLGVWIAFIVSLVFVAVMLLARFAFKAGIWRLA
jgi:MATE family multidrug resistance protein